MKLTIGQAITEYEQHARSMGLSDSYLRIQTGYLKRFAAACGGGQLTKVKPSHIAQFFQTLPNTRGSQNRALSALKSFMKFCERMKYLRAGSTDWLLGDRKSKTFVRQPKYYIPVQQFGPMIAAAGRRHPVERMTLALAFYTLGRQGEIAGLRLRDLDLEAMTLRIYRPKRKRWTVVQICPELRDELFIWLCKYADETNQPPPMGVLELIEKHPDWYLVPGLECIKVRAEGGYWDSDLTRYEIRPEKQALRLERLVKRMLDQFGAQTEDGKHVRHKGEGMHTIRRSGARAMIDYLATQWGEDKALLMVSTMLDHESTTMTLLYIGRSLEQKRLNAYLANNSPYGTGMALDGPVSLVDGTGDPAGVTAKGEVDAL